MKDIGRTTQGRSSEPSPQGLLRSSRVTVASASVLSVGALLLDGRFVVEGVLGQGGMGVVYDALDTHVNQRVALKMLTWIEASAEQRLKHEFRALSDVVHPNLVGLRGLYQDGARCFLTMDLVRGVPFFVSHAISIGAAATTAPLGPLAFADTALTVLQDDDQLLCDTSHKRDPSALRKALIQLFSGVAAIHQAGKVHRDLKPSNVLVTESGRVVILDFGLVGDKPRTSAAVEDQVSGTPAYMAPEQAAGAPPAPENDCYAVGVMLYEVLTGQLPFRGSPTQVMVDKQLADPPHPRQRDSTVDAELADLCMDLLTRDIARRPSATAALRRLGAVAEAHAPSLPPPHSLHFFGRGPLLNMLQLTVQHVTAHRRAALVEISGHSGVGKTALIEHFANTLQIESNVLWLSGRCYEREALPHKGIDQVLVALSQALRGRHSDLDLHSLLSSHELLALRTLLPELDLAATCQAKDQSLRMSEPRALRQRAYRALSTLLTAVAQRVLLVIAIDDMQWADSDGVRLLLEIMGGPTPPPLLLVLSHRSEDLHAHDALRHFQDQSRHLLSAVELVHLDVQSLSDRDSTALARDLLAKAQVPYTSAELDILCREAKGNPLLLGELVRHYVERASHNDAESALTLEQLLRQRLSVLAPKTRLLFDLACVAERPIGPRILATAANTADDEDDLRLLLQARLLRACRDRGADAVDVFHDSIRERGLEALHATELQQHHRALAHAHEREPIVDVERLAAHHAGAGHAAQAASYAEQAAVLAENSLAFDRAAEFYKTALDLYPELSENHRGQLNLRLAEVLSSAGRGAEAAPLFMAVASQTDRAHALPLRRRAAEQWLVSGHTDAGMAALRSVVHDVGLRLPAGNRRALLSLLATRARLRLRGLHFVAREESEVGAAELLRIDACRAAWALSFLNPIQGAAFQARFLELALRAGESRRIAIGLGMEAIFRSTKGAPALRDVMRLLAEQERLANKLDDALVHAFLPLARGQSHYMMGRWRACSDALSEAEDLLLGRCRNVTWELNSSRFFWGNALVLQGRWRELAARLDPWIRDARERSDLYASSGLELLSTRCVTLAADDPCRARQEIHQAMRLWQSTSFGVQQFLAEMSHMQVSLYEGRGSDAVQRLDAMWQDFSRSMMTKVQLCRIQAHYHAAYAMLSSAQQETHNAPLLGRAKKHASALRTEAVAWALPFADYIEAAVAYLSGDEARAVAGLQRAREGFQSCNMELYATAIERRLGRILGGDSGARCLQHAEQIYYREGIRNPERLSAMMAPGFRDS